jgi:hypothetical protein
VEIRIWFTTRNIKSGKSSIASTEDQAKCLKPLARYFELEGWA